MSDPESTVRPIIVAYNEGKSGNPYHPGYTENERVAWEIGKRHAEQERLAYRHGRKEYERTHRIGS